MAIPPVDTSVTGYCSGSVAPRQDDIYRNSQRPPPHVLTNNDSGYGSDFKIDHLNFQVPPSLSLLGMAALAQCQELLDNPSNFAPSTSVDCFESDGASLSNPSLHVASIHRSLGPDLKPGFRHLDEAGLNECIASSVQDRDGQAQHRCILFLSTLDFDDGASYKAKSSFGRLGLENLISTLDMNPRFVPDLLGRPNYWSPELYGSGESRGGLESIDFFCQHPRWAIHAPNFKQKSPVSIYMRFDAVKNLTYYVIAAPEQDECAKTFKGILNKASKNDEQKRIQHATLQDPFEGHVLLSKLSCESSQGYINHFRQSMFAQLRIVDELSAQETVNRKGLADVTIELQIISKDVNKLISDADVASLNLARMQEAHERLGQIDDTIVSLTHRQQIADSLQYLTSSMRKQKMWLLNYRDRKDIAMSLVFNLVTQQDAANNIEIAKDMRKDSSSMNGIALLTMIFLPGTFTSTILGAGLFTAFAQNHSVHVSSLWWFWAALTFPLTAIVLILWAIYCWREETKLFVETFILRKKKPKEGDVEAQK